MQGAPIEALNRGLQTFKDDLMRDPVAPKRVEVAIVTFDNDVNVVQDFITADRFEAPKLECQGMTHMAAGINTASVLGLLVGGGLIGFTSILAFF
jgi:uncharacterized protein YegL